MTPERAAVPFYAQFSAGTFTGRTVLDTPLQAQSISIVPPPPTGAIPVLTPCTVQPCKTLGRLGPLFQAQCPAVSAHRTAVCVPSLLDTEAQKQAHTGSACRLCLRLACWSRNRLQQDQRDAGTPGETAGAGGAAHVPAWAALAVGERAEWMQATVLQAVSASLGRAVGLEEPLMTAGLDSLGTDKLP